MLADAEKYKAEDEKQQEKVKARNQLETYTYGVKQAVEEAPADKVSESEKKTTVEKCQEVMKWLDNNLLAEKDEYEYKLKEIQKETQPIMMKLHGRSGAGGDGGKSSSGPKVEEVD